MKDINLNKNYYSVLFLKKDCELSSIRKSYRKLSFKYHPDKNKDKEAIEKFQIINEAYKILSDSKKREYFDSNSLYGNSYDYKNNTIIKQTDYSSKVNKEFQEKEKYFLKKDITKHITISFEDYYKGTPINIHYYRLVECDECNGYGNDPNGGIECAMCDGTGKTNYNTSSKCSMCGGKKYISTELCKPCKGKGIRENKQLIRIDKFERFSPGERYNQEKLKGGNYIKNTNTYGKFLLIIDIENNSKYKIDKDNILHTKIDVHYKDAIDGNKIKYQHIDNKFYNIKLNENSKDKDIIKLKKKGLKEGKTRKDLHIHLNIIIDYGRL